MGILTWLILGILLLFVAVVIYIFYIRFETPTSDSTPDTTPSTQPTRLRVTNNCSEDMWVQQLNIPGEETNILLKAGKSYDYNIPDSYTPAVRVWPKTGCDENGENCETGQSQPPCPQEGCQPPFESKAEFTFGDIKNSADTTTYDLSFVDGFTVPIKIIAKGQNIGQGVCKSIDGSKLTLDKCPTNDNLAGTPADLRVKDSSGKTIACLSPCQYSTQPAPYGIGGDIADDPALHMCCPTPCEYLDCQQGDACNCEETSCFVCIPNSECTWENSCATTDSCSDANNPKCVKNTDYYTTVKKYCPDAYGYAYDDNPKNANVTFVCPSVNQYEVVFCPG